jgi:hypothetical protein
VSETPTLATLVRPLPPLSLGDGREVAVRPFSFRMRALAREIDETPEGAAQDEKLLRLARLCAPGLSEDDALDLSPAEVLTIIAHAAGRLDAMLGAVGNAPAPAAVGKSRRRSR